MNRDRIFLFAVLCAFVLAVVVVDRIALIFTDHNLTKRIGAIDDGTRIQSIRFQQITSMLRQSTSLPGSAEGTSELLQEGTTRTISPENIQPSFSIVSNYKKIDVAGWIASDFAHYTLIREWLQKLDLPESTIVIDAGGNLGFYSLYAAALGYTTHTFEIQKELLKFALAGSHVSGTGSRTNFHNVGLGSEEGIMDVSGNDGVAFLSSSGGAPTRPTRVSTLDKFMRSDAGLSLATCGVAFLKVDVEGFEIQVIKGSRWIIDNLNVGSLLMEISPQWWVRSGVSESEGVLELTRMHKSMGGDALIMLRGDEACPLSLSKVLSSTRILVEGVEAAVPVMNGEWKALIKEMVTIPNPSCNIWITVDVADYMQRVSECSSAQLSERPVWKMSN